LFRRWRAAKSKSERHKHFVQLSELCKPAISRALQDIALKESSSVEVWLDRRGLSREEVYTAVFPAVQAAAHRYDPDHESGANFPTFAMGDIRGEVAQIAENWPPRVSLEGPAGEPEDQPQEELHAEEEPRNFADIVALVYEHPVSETVQKIYKRAKYPDEHSSEELRSLTDKIEEEFADALQHDVKLQTLHDFLLAMATRAKDFEGRMVQISTLWHLLLLREQRKARGMPAESYSPNALGRVFGRPAPNTLRKWFKACDKEGITAENCTPEQLAKIVSPERGPKFRGRITHLPSRPDG